MIGFVMPENGRFCVMMDFLGGCSDLVCFLCVVVVMLFFFISIVRLEVYSNGN